MDLLHPITISTTFLCLLAAGGVIPFVGAAEITTEDLYKKITPTAAQPGFNVEGGSVFTHVAKAMNEGQLFFLRNGSWIYERPDSELVLGAQFHWCSDLTFSDVNNSSLIGYAGRCVNKPGDVGRIHRIGGIRSSVNII